MANGLVQVVLLTVLVDCILQLLLLLLPAARMERFVPKLVRIDVVRDEDAGLHR